MIVLVYKRLQFNPVTCIWSSSNEMYPLIMIRLLLFVQVTTPVSLKLGKTKNTMEKNKKKDRKIEDDIQRIGFHTQQTGYCKSVSAQDCEQTFLSIGVDWKGIISYPAAPSGCYQEMFSDAGFFNKLSQSKVRCSLINRCICEAKRPINCGNHTAASCSICPRRNNSLSCQGDCKWCNGKCVSKGFHCIKYIVRTSGFCVSINYNNCEHIIKTIGATFKGKESTKWFPPGCYTFKNLGHFNERSTSMVECSDSKKCYCDPTQKKLFTPLEIFGIAIGAIVGVGLFFACIYLRCC